MRSRIILALTTILLFAAACGSSATPASVDSAASPTETADAGDRVADQSDEPDQTDEADEPSSPASDADDAAPSDRRNESPIAELFGIPVSDEDAMQDQFAQLQAEAERKIAVCMREQGFEYQPVDYSKLNAFDTAIDFESRAFAEEYGFGIANSIDGGFSEAIEDFVDPNQEYVASLSDGERNAYMTAMLGEALSPDGLNDDGNAFTEPSGCTGDAYEAAFEQFALFDEFGDELDQLSDSMEADPRIVELNASWATCMFDRGFGYSNYDDARDDIQRRYQAIIAEEGAQPPAPGADEDDDAVQIVIGPSFSPEVQAKVDALGDEEIEVAIATWDCEQSLRATYEEVRVEYERNFVEQYGDAVRAASGGN